MIIYKCIINDHEMFSDIFKLTEGETFYEVEGSMVSRVEGFDESSIGANASAEEVSDTIEPNSVSGVDIVLNHHLTEINLSKDAFKSYIKEYAKDVKNKLQETNPDRVAPFMKNMQEGVKRILGNFKNFQFFMADGACQGSLGMLDFREDGVTPYMLFFKDGLEIVKC